MCSYLYILEPAFLEKVAQQEAEEKNAASQVMQTTIEEVVNHDGKKQLVTTIKPATDAVGERVFQYDIMISYCHADKELTYKIHKYIVDQGFKVWIDLDNMYGPGKMVLYILLELILFGFLAMNAMADAVENSEFVIMCMSDSYKQSTYCQAEAEYAFNCKRRLIPLVMRQGYKPDGWLGFMIGSRIYVDFGRFDFETACEKLMTEISLQRKKPLPSKQVAMNQHEKPTVTNSNKPQISAPRREHPLLIHSNNVLSTHMKRKPSSDFIKKRMKEWTESDVLDFLFTHGLIQLMPLCEMMNGRALVQLYKMSTSRSSRVYVLLDDELKSTYKIKLPIGIYTRFLSVMEERITAPPSAPSRTVVDVPITTVTTIPKAYVSHTSRKPVNNSLTFQYPSHPDKPYDLLITSDAPALQILKALERYGPNIEKLSSVQSQNSVRF
jgi:hypothetical protein